MPTATILDLIRSRAIDAATQVWTRDMPSWQPAGSVGELAYALNTAPRGDLSEGALGLNTTGLIIFIVLLMTCLPLCWLPWVIEGLRARK